MHALVIAEIRGLLMINIARAAVLGMFAASLAYAPAHAAITMKLNESLGPGSAEETALLKFKKDVEEGSKGDLQVQLFFQDQLGNPQTSLENLMTGSLDLYSGALEYYEPLAKTEFSVTSLAYFLPDSASLQKYLVSPVFMKAKDEMLKRGIRFLESDAVRGPYRVIVSNKPVLSVNDVEGLKLRMYPNDIAVHSWQTLGAVTLQVGFGQTYLAIRQGVVQSVTVPLSAVRSSKFTEVAPYITAIKEYPQVWPITISEKTWAKLSPDQQKLMMSAAADASTTYTNATNQHALEDVDAMIKENHAVFIQLDTAPFRKKMEPYYQQLIKDGILRKDVYDTVQDIIGQK
jgi:TRAP-type C4-dicarboxylate transport system substrate-binding protein